MSYLCLGVEKTIFKEIMQFHKLFYMITPLHKNPCPRGHDIYNFGRPFLGHHYYIHGLSDLCLGVDKQIFKEIMHFHYMTYVHAPAQEPLPQGSWNLQFGWPYLGYHFYILGLFYICLGEDKKIFKEIMHFHYMAYLTTP